MLIQLGLALTFFVVVVVTVGSMKRLTHVHFIDYSEDWNNFKKKLFKENSLSLQFRDLWELVLL